MRTGAFLATNTHCPDDICVPCSRSDISVKARGAKMTPTWIDRVNYNGRSVRHHDGNLCVVPVRWTNLTQEFTV